MQTIIKYTTDNVVENGREEGEKEKNAEEGRKKGHCIFQFRNRDPEYQCPGIGHYPGFIRDREGVCHKHFLTLLWRLLTLWIEIFQKTTQRIFLITIEY